MKLRLIKRLLLPIGVFAVVFIANFVWHGIFPEQDPAQSAWVSVETVPHAGWLQLYIQKQDYWLGFSYALSLAFAAYALRRYYEERFCRARNLAIGGITFSGFLAVAGCFLIGCCGSPVLAVYLNLFGAAFLPLTKPIVAAITAVSISGALVWMNYRKRPVKCGCEQPSCNEERNL